MRTPAARTPPRAGVGDASRKRDGAGGIAVNADRPDAAGESDRLVHGCVRVEQSARLATGDEPPVRVVPAIGESSATATSPASTARVNRSEPGNATIARGPWAASVPATIAVAHASSARAVIEGAVWLDVGDSPWA
jgi:hypothetical protein